MSQPINVRKHAHKPLFTAAKDAVYGDGTFVQGKHYSGLQIVINTTVRNDPRCLRWATNAPPAVQRLNFKWPASFRHAFSRFLRLSEFGEKKLQRTLVSIYGHQRRL